jgi:hypothetical protein
LHELEVEHEQPGRLSPVIMQWEVKDGFVKESKVRLRFPKPETIRNRPDASVVGTADSSAELNNVLLSRHFRLDLTGLDNDEISYV